MLETGALAAQMPQAYVPQGRGTRAQTEQNRGEGFAKVFGKHTARGDLPVGRRRAPGGGETSAEETACAVPPPAAMQQPAPFAEQENPAVSIDTEVDSVVIPARPASQEDLSALVARLAGDEGNGDFLRVLEPFLQKILDKRGLDKSELSRPVAPPRPAAVSSAPQGGVGAAEEIAPAEAAPENADAVAAEAQAGPQPAERTAQTQIAAFPQDLPLENEAEKIEITVMPVGRRIPGPVSAASAGRGFATAMAAVAEEAPAVYAEESAEAAEAPELEAVAGDEREASTGAPEAGGDDGAIRPGKDEEPAPRAGDAPETVRSHVRRNAEPAPAPEAAPVRRAAAADIAEAVKTAEQPSAETSIEIELAPKSLGKLNISLTASEDGVTARIKSGSDAVREMLSSNLSALRQALKDAGINMKNIEIARRDVGWDFSRGSFSRQNQGFEGKDGTGGRTSSSGRVGLSGGAERAAVAVSGTIYAAGAAAPDMWSDASFDYRA